MTELQSKQLKLLADEMQAAESANWAKWVELEMAPKRKRPQLQREADALNVRAQQAIARYMQALEDAGFRKPATNNEGR